MIVLLDERDTSDQELSAEEKCVATILTLVKGDTILIGEQSAAMDEADSVSYGSVGRGCTTL